MMRVNEQRRAWGKWRCPNCMMCEKCGDSEAIPLSLYLSSAAAGTAQSLDGGEIRKQSQTEQNNILVCDVCDQGKYPK